VTVVATPDPDTVPSRNSGQGGGAAGGGRRPGPEGGEADVDEEPASPRVLQHRPVECEQHDVGGGHVQGHPEQPLDAHVGLADQAFQVVALVAQVPAEGEQAAEEGVGHEGQADGGQDPADRAPGRLQHQQDRDHAQDHVQPGGPDDPAGEVVEHQQGVDERDQGQAGQGPVERPRVVAARLAFLVAGLAATGHGPVGEQGHGQGDGQERGPVGLGWLGPHHPEQGVQRHRDRGRRDEQLGQAAQVAGRVLGLELGRLDLGMAMGGGAVVGVVEPLGHPASD
jgi:hypothetical protein